MLPVFPVSSVSNTWWRVEEMPAPTSTSFFPAIVFGLFVSPAVLVMTLLPDATAAAAVAPEGTVSPDTKEKITPKTHTLTVSPNPLRPTSTLSGARARWIVCFGSNSTGLPAGAAFHAMSPAPIAVVRAPRSRRALLAADQDAGCGSCESVSVPRLVSGHARK